MSYRFIKKKISVNVKGTKEDRYVARLWQVITLEQDYIIDMMVERSTASRADIEMVIQQFNLQLKQLLQNGQSLNLKRLGIFRPALNVKMVKSADEVDGSTIKGATARFIVSGDMKKRLDNTKIEFKDLNKIKHV